MEENPAPPGMHKLPISTGAGFLPPTVPPIVAIIRSDVRLGSFIDSRSLVRKLVPIETGRKHQSTL